MVSDEGQMPENVWIVHELAYVIAKISADMNMMMHHYVVIDGVRP